ncbi:hypothetical protein D6810_01990 [Candidatus Dojkabacteria bacterium]|uniref:Uncharacterized protein n=1 Tax=Candidatus Dojkabacteria bacterium TaxID=2099670 RepID=A0A3M0YYH7_9BACT|nr:MAG: hypothetical protein D6810_01990 [Candidatus Dojkabacteria bacterium]
MQEETFSQQGPKKERIPSISHRLKLLFDQECGETSRVLGLLANGIVEGFHLLAQTEEGTPKYSSVLAQLKVPTLDSLLGSASKFGNFLDIQNLSSLLSEDLKANFGEEGVNALGNLEEQIKDFFEEKRPYLEEKILKTLLVFYDNMFDKLYGLIARYEQSYWQANSDKTSKLFYYFSQTLAFVTYLITDSNSEVRVSDEVAKKFYTEYLPNSISRRFILRLTNNKPEFTNLALNLTKTLIKELLRFPYFYYSEGHYISGFFVGLINNISQGTGTMPEWIYELLQDHLKNIDELSGAIKKIVTGVGARDEFLNKMGLIEYKRKRSGKEISDESGEEISDEMYKFQGLLGSGGITCPVHLNQLPSIEKFESGLRDELSMVITEVLQALARKGISDGELVGSFISFLERVSNLVLSVGDSYLMIEFLSELSELTKINIQVQDTSLREKIINSVYELASNHIKHIISICQRLMPETTESPNSYGQISDLDSQFLIGILDFRFPGIPDPSWFFGSLRRLVLNCLEYIQNPNLNNKESYKEFIELVNMYHTNLSELELFPINDDQLNDQLKRVMGELKREMRELKQVLNVADFVLKGPQNLGNQSQSSAHQ